MDWNISPTLELLLLSQVLEVLTHLPPSAKCWDYRNIPLHQVHKGARNQIQSMLGKHSTKDFILSSLKAVFIRLIYENQISSWHFHVMKFWFILPTIHSSLHPSYPVSILLPEFLLLLWCHVFRWSSWPSPQSFCRSFLSLLSPGPLSSSCLEPCLLPPKLTSKGFQCGLLLSSHFCNHSFQNIHSVSHGVCHKFFSKC